jgi:hypothetical protein
MSQRTTTFTVTIVSTNEIDAARLEAVLDQSWDIRLLGGPGTYTYVTLDEEY